MAQQSWLHRRHACDTLDSKYMERRFSGRCGGSKERRDSSMFARVCVFGEAASRALPRVKTIDVRDKIEAAFKRSAEIDARRINVNAAEGDGFATRVGQRANRVQR